jgi:hypothetical protein
MIEPSVGCASGPKGENIERCICAPKVFLDTQISPSTRHTTIFDIVVNPVPIFLFPKSARKEKRKKETDDALQMMKKETKHPAKDSAVG